MDLFDEAATANTKGRPRRARDLARPMGVRFTDAERATLAETATALNVTVAELVRAGALQAARAGPALLAQEAIAVHRAAGALAAVGRNLNQIARALNGDGDVRTAEIVDLVEAVAGHVRNAVRLHQALVEAHAKRGERARIVAARRRSP